ncbi:hypothetical protein [Streptomyces sp. Isolate_45]|uniref:hypothetical protein n=1 Tax=Streptomyces sp. Isolate_45 TaxID=2950111 RepID=UPI002481AB4E|nr:hypothetical protein [Streptomyces sp. Isolate_45]MDA5284318.1 hypothetical protein [Streptomyces sp. Isolate_45]
MSSGETEATIPAVEETAVHQIPAVIRVAQPPAAADSRDRLLVAIGAQADRLAGGAGGQEATGLEALARAYAIVTSSTASAATAAATQEIAPTGRSSANQYWKVEVWDHDHIGKDQLETGGPTTIDDFH